MKAILFILLLAYYGSAEVLVRRNGLQIVRSAGNALDYVLESNGGVILRGKLGLALPDATGEATTTCNPEESDLCYEWGDYARLYMNAPSGPDNCARVEWVSDFGRRLEDCFELQAGVHWYGGGETEKQTWPIETIPRDEAPYVTGDFIWGTQFGGVLDTYWVTSSGVALHVDEDTPLFTSMTTQAWNTSRTNQFCLIAQDRYPYTERTQVRLKYDLCVPKAGENFRDVHLRSLKRYYSTPSALPDESMLVYPFWSTWAEYKEGVTQQNVIDMARRMIQEGYTQNSHIEIDDKWEGCRGDNTFDSEKFPDPAGMMRTLAELGITRTTVWIHPFVNIECQSFQTAFSSSYFLKDAKSKQAITSWWQGSDAGLIDFSSPDSVNWWRSRLERLQREYNITSFKFDAGESKWLPASYRLSEGNSDLLPNIFTTKYVEAAASLGGMIETRSAHRNQGLAFFTRMLDKFSRWDDVNGLRSLIPTLLLFSVLGYSFVLPDMIGGNAYGSEIPSTELYIRWAQANVFMPSWQFSVLPWDRDPSGQLDRIVKAAVDLRISHLSYILDAARQTLVDGSPMNRPLWWVDPEDPQTYTISDQYMLGDAILVAPVVYEGAVSRDIYLPKGAWQIETASGLQNFTGPQWLRDWPAPLDTLPFFKRL